MNLPQIHSITKKICVALIGAFLLIFLLFHSCANLCILRNDGGAWYNAFCHFMGTNIFVKIFEVILLALFVFHICLTMWLWFTNHQARGNQRYHVTSKTKTHPYSKLMPWTGLLILLLLFVHFHDFYFVKMGWVPGNYMVQTEEIFSKPELNQMVQVCQQYNMTPEDYMAANDQQLEQMKSQGQIGEEELAEINSQLDKVRELVPVATVVMKAQTEKKFSEDNKYIQALSYEDRNAINAIYGKGTAESDFYHMAREKFTHWYMVLVYLLFFAVLGLHLRHGFSSAFQTLGLNNYKYNKAIEIIGIIYTWCICLIFSLVALGVFIPSL